MSKLLTELYKAAATTFEELAFMIPNEGLEEQPPTTPTDKVVSVAFHGPFDGHVDVLVDRALLPVVAANMLGEEEALSDSQLRDALGEIANVICGNLLPRVAGTSEVFKIFAPRHRVSEASLVDEQPAAEVRLWMDEGWAAVKMFIADETAAGKYLS